jgi:hypothetical protein
MAWVCGTNLSGENKTKALANFVHRFTGDFTPSWATKPMPSGNPYPLHFASDREWLENTQFCLTEKGTFSRRTRHCMSNPTWPNNPELRKNS